MLNNFMPLKAHKLNLPIFTILVILILFACRIQTNNSDPTTGWKPVNSPPEAFKPGVVLDGRPPTDYEIALVEPEHNPRVVAKASSTQNLVVLIKYHETQGYYNPPSFVKLLVQHKTKKKHNNTLVMLPYRKTANEFYYSYSLRVPNVPGDYALSIQAEHAVFAENSKEFEPLEPYKKTRDFVLRVTR